MIEKPSILRTELGQEIVLVIGGSADIALELVRQIAGQRPIVVAHYNQSRKKIEQLAAQLPELRIVPIQADLASAEQTDGFVKTLVQMQLVPDKILHLASPKFEYVRFKDADWPHYQKNLDVQFRSIAQVLGAMLPEMAKRGGGKVVALLSSVTLNNPPSSLAPYVIAKYALLGLLRSLAAEYAPRRITINAVSPSAVQTAFLEGLEPRMVEIVASQAPLGRLASPADVAGAIRFLFSDEADFITGVNWPITGGA